MPKIKMVLSLLMVSVIPFFIGYGLGYSKGWVHCVDLGLNFVRIDNVVDRELIRSGLLHLKSTAEGWAFDPNSPLYIGNNNTVSTP